ncbi:MAG: ABC transporter permease [SAR324 cluster bacterium]|nr:ABC transporter permease [SAR324 cluster bacterium]
MTDIAGTPVSQDIFADEETWFDMVQRFFRTKPLGSIGLVVVFIFIFIAMFADVLAPYHPLELDYELFNALPSAQHLLGTDDNGRDLLSRMIFGARTAMLVGFVCSMVGSALGLVVGVASAYFGGKTDLIIQRIVDVFMSFPLIVLALAIVSIVPRVEMGFLPEPLKWLWPELFATTTPVIVAITIPMIPRCARVVRASALAVREVPYVDAARALGLSHWRIIFKHMVPNVMAPYLIILTAFMGQAVLLEASLSYLALGVQEPTPAWGLMLQGSAEQYARSAPHTAIFPGLAITLSVFAFNMFGDGLRDVLDPKLRV